MRRITSKVLLLITIICITTVKLYAQGSGIGKITGKIVDAETNEGIPYASAILLDKKTKAIVKVAQSDVDGVFLLGALQKGSYTFKASYVGFQTMVRDSVAITDAVMEVNFGSIKMKTAKGNILSEVTITAPKATMQMGIDKKIFSVDQSLVSEGGSASDLLQNVPSVQTDIDGNVSLRGSSGVKVLIDGKPSLIAGGNIAQILQSIPASSIESVELITNPSAKYDAEGQSGIINIVLKRNKKLGFNGSVALTAGNRENYNANTSLSFQNKKVNLYGNYSYRYGNRIGGGYNNIQYLNPAINSLAFASQENDSKDLNKGHNLKAGIDYYVAEKSVISLSTGLNFRNGDENEFLNINQLYSNRNPFSLSYRNNNEQQTGNSFDLNMDFTQKFKRPKEEFTASFGFSEGNNDNYQIYNTNVYNVQGNNTNDIDIQRTDRDGFNRNYNIQLDYTRPLGEFGKLEAGYRSQVRISESSTFADQLSPAGSFDFNYMLSNEFNNKDQVHAAYINYQNQVKNFGYQIGFRGEDSRLDTRMGAYKINSNLAYTPGKVAYTRIYPSVYLTQKLSEEQQLQLSYSRRVNRPRGWDTNPFMDVSDPLNHRQGNPNLQPEDVHAFELSYSRFWKKFSVISSAYMRRTDDVIQRIRTEPDANGITITTPQNLTRNVSSGLELIGRFDLVKKWNFTANVNLYQSKIIGVPAFGIVENAGFSWNANLTNNFTLPLGITLQVKGDYRAAEVMAQGKRNAMYGMDAGAKYDLPNKKSSISLNIRDVFGTRRWHMTTTGNTSTVDFSRQMQGTMANLTYSYRFGKTTFGFKKTKKQDDQGGRPDEESF
ncbi:outer membrane beta-barrel family protein [Pedobacter insulae]|uniref:Outer membrane receptor proteins, mostly Fe transport n=1 Tax=Pedobacter insulae TaxID=414048 RepID=A0A1I2T5M6_9SPHI|nr:outer membrane beta-barrel family protein [Pedobacter insulae]SFG60354.1 Outer membrane receptor proteins, mostly Fe transport [Pedobacter insulae]